MNAQDSMVTSVGGSANEAHPIASLTLADTIGPDRPLPLRRRSVSSIRHAMLAVVLLVAGTSSAAFGDQTSAGVTVLRGTPARVEQLPEPRRVQLMPPPLPSCPDGYAYSPFLGTCYRPRDPLNPVP
jgi:hypothetical protein